MGTRRFRDLLLNRTVWLLLLIVLTGAGLRWEGLGRRSFWLDESWDIVHVQRPLPEVIQAVAGINYPPLHQILQHFVLSILGVSERTARLQSFFFGTAVIPIVFLLARCFLPGGWSLTAAALFALAPYPIHMTGAGRMYMTLLFFSCLSTWSVLARLEHERPALRMLFILATLWSAYTHYLAGAVLLCQLVLAVVRRRQNPLLLRHLLLDCLVVELFFLPWLGTMAGQVAFYPGGPQGTRLGSPRTVELFWHTWCLYANGAATPFGPLLLGGLVVTSWTWGDAGFRRVMLALLCTAAVLATVFSRIGTYFAPHYFLFVMPWLLICAAYGAALLPFPWLRVLVIVVLVCDFCTGLYHMRRLPDPWPWREVLPLVLPYNEPPNVLLLVPAYNDLPLRAYGVHLATMPPDSVMSSPRRMEQVITEAIALGRGVLLLGTLDDAHRALAQRTAAATGLVLKDKRGEIDLYTRPGW